MKIWIDRDTCDSNLAACLSCFGQLLITGTPDRGCIVNYEDDGSEDFTIFMHSDGEDHEPLFIPADMREMVAFEGLDRFVSFQPEFRKNEGSER
jgi:hypothetical protein